MALLDSFGRRINYLRLSVTDRCNLSSGLDLSPFLGEGYDPAALMSALRGVAYRKPGKHGLSDRNAEPKPFLMSAGDG
jgi:hypothetical protein